MNYHKRVKWKSRYSQTGFFIIWWNYDLFIAGATTFVAALFFLGALGGTGGIGGGGGGGASCTITGGVKFTSSVGGGGGGGGGGGAFCSITGGENCTSSVDGGAGGGGGFGAFTDFGGGGGAGGVIFFVVWAINWDAKTMAVVNRIIFFIQKF